MASPFPCDWCVDGHRCTHDTAENCRNDILVTGIKRVGPSIRSGPNFCPRVNATVGGSSEILVPSGIKETIRVKVDNIAQFIVQTRFVCQFNIEGRVTSVNAQLLGELIYCDAMEFAYTSRYSSIDYNAYRVVVEPALLLAAFFYGMKFELKCVYVYSPAGSNTACILP